MEITKRGDYQQVRFRYKGRYPRITNNEWRVDTFKKKDIELLASREVEAKIKEIDEEISQQEKTSHSLETMLNKFVENDTLNVKELTALADKYVLNYYVLNYFGKDNTASEVITPKSVNEFRLSLVKDNKLAEKTISTYLSKFKKFIDYLVVMDELDGNVAYKIKLICKPIKTNQKEINSVEKGNYLTPEEAKKLFETFSKEDPYYYLLHTTYLCGLRIGEALGLKFNDFDYENRTLAIKRQYLCATRNIASTKTNISNSTILVPQVLLNEIREYQSLMLANDDDFMFFPKKRVARGTIQSILSEHLQQADLPRITLHGLRHSYASLLANSKEKFTGLTIQHQLRHASYTTTSKTYEHWFDNEKDKMNIDSLCNI